MRARSRTAKRGATVPGLLGNQRERSELLLHRRRRRVGFPPAPLALVTLRWSCRLVVG